MDLSPEWLWVTGRSHNLNARVLQVFFLIYFQIYWMGRTHFKVKDHWIVISIEWSCKKYIAFMAKDCVANRHFENESFDDLIQQKEVEWKNNVWWKRKTEMDWKKITCRMLKVSNWKSYESAFTSAFLLLDIILNENLKSGKSEKFMVF